MSRRWTTRWMTVLMLLMLLPLTVRAQSGPRDVVAAFLEAWNAQDLNRMYSLLSPQSQEFFAQQVFDLRYTLTHETMGFEGVTFTIGEERIQGITAAVKYDVVVKSAAFGDIVDNGRTMRLAQNNGVWGIAWSSMDIFDALTADSTISAAGRLPARA
ncbi:MAG TPA: NTF2-like N-terminal transpeptidase domain-containing protein, partial [Aggregatilineales bacterium]|nr:NTF2-like N-terminal transpeptidase domain-containing protein [Aggregatilineales bacterium]